MVLEGCALGEECCWTTKLIRLTYESDRHSSKSYYRLRGYLPLGMLLWIMHAPSPASLKYDSAIYAISDYNFASLTCKNSGAKHHRFFPNVYSAICNPRGE